MFKKRRAERSGAATDGSAAAEPTAAPGVADNDPAAAQDKPDAVQMVKDRRDRRDSEGDPADMPGAMGVIAQQDEDIDTLLGIIDVLKAAGTTLRAAAATLRPMATARALKATLMKAATPHRIRKTAQIPTMTSVSCCTLSVSATA
jgi:hypothetical protein